MMMSEADLPESKKSLKIRIGALATSALVLGWLSQSLIRFSLREAERSSLYGGGKVTYPMPAAIIAGGVILLMLLLCVSAWRGAHKPLAPRGAIVEPWGLRLAMDWILAVLAVLVIVIGGALSVGLALDGRVVVVVVTALPVLLSGILLALWSPLVVVDPATRTLVRHTWGTWAPLRRTIPFDDVAGLFLLQVFRGASSTPLSFVFKAQLKNGKSVDLFTQGGIVGPHVAQAQLARFAQETNLPLLATQTKNK